MTILFERSLTKFFFFSQIAEYINFSGSHLDPTRIDLGDRRTDIDAHRETKCRDERREHPRKVLHQWSEKSTYGRIKSSEPPLHS